MFRKSSHPGVARLHKLGARHVINPEVEGGLEIVRHALLELDYPVSKLSAFVDAARREAYAGRFDGIDDTAESIRALDQLLTAVRGVDIAWMAVPPTSALAGATLGSTRLRTATGASVVAIMRNREVIPNPSAATTLAAGDLLGLIGTAEEQAAVAELVSVEASPLTS